MLRFIDLACARYRWNVGSRTANANRTWQERSGLFVRLRTDAGVEGYGEASPLPGFSPDDLDACEATLTRAWRECAPLQTDGSARDALRASLAPANISSAAATFALESAMLDALGKVRGAPAWRLMRDPSDGQPDPIPISALLSATSIEENIAQAVAAIARGIRVGKVKINGRDPEREFDRARALHEAVTPLGMTLRFDANQSFDLAAASKWIARIAVLSPDVLEEPVPTDRWNEIASSEVRLGMDESLFEADWRGRSDACAARGITGAFVLKPMAIGGWLRCLELARHARDLGWWSYLTHLFDGPIAAAATAELALSIGNENHPSGLDVYGRSDDWPTGAPPQIGSMHVLPCDHHGLGVDEIARRIWPT